MITNIKKQRLWGGKKARIEVKLSKIQYKKYKTKSSTEV